MFWFCGGYCSGSGGEGKRFLVEIVLAVGIAELSPALVQIVLSSRDVPIAAGSTAGSAAVGPSSSLRPSRTEEPRGWKWRKMLLQDAAAAVCSHTLIILGLYRFSSIRAHAGIVQLYVSSVAANRGLMSCALFRVAVNHRGGERDMMLRHSLATSAIVLAAAGIVRALSRRLVLRYLVDLDPKANAAAPDETGNRLRKIDREESRCSAVCEEEAAAAAASPSARSLTARSSSSLFEMLQELTSSAPLHEAPATQPSAPVDAHHVDHNEQTTPDASPQRRSSGQQEVRNDGISSKNNNKITADDSGDATLSLRGLAVDVAATVGRAVLHCAFSLLLAYPSVALDFVAICSRGVGGGGGGDSSSARVFDVTDIWTVGLVQVSSLLTSSSLRRCA